MDFIEEHYLGTLDNHTNDMTEKLDSYLKNKDVDLLEVRINVAKVETYTEKIVLRALIVNSAKSNNDREGPRAAKSKAYQSTVQK